MKNIVINIDGNIGAGKTFLSEIIKSNFKNVYIIKEGVDEDEYCKMEFQKYQLDKKKYSFSFDHALLENKMKNIKTVYKKIKNSSKIIIIFDRSVQYDINVFSKIRFESGHITHEQYDTLKKLGLKIQNFIDKKFKSFVTINMFLKTSIDICLKRIEQRNRENEHVTLNDLKLIEKKHLKIKNNQDVFLDSNYSKEYILEILLSKINK